MRAALVALAAVGSSVLWAYHPDGNVVRGIYVSSGDVITYGAWSPYNKPGQFADGQAHSGRSSLLCDNGQGGPGTAAGMVQRVELNQKQPRSLKIAGWSRAEGVQGKQGWQYSLYVDFVFADGKSWPMKIATFPTGTHGWVYAETTVTPPRPLKSARFYAFLREYPGRVWFDDLFFGEPGGKNLLRCPGFEPAERDLPSPRQEIFEQWHRWHANAMQVYLSSAHPFWPSKITPTPYFKPGDSPLERFLADAAAHGIGVWTTPASPVRPIKSAHDPDFPEYYCPNSYWGDDWNAELADMARFDFAGISVVPDEYNYSNGYFKRRFARHPDAAVREFYKKLPYYCDCPACGQLFKKEFGLPLPDLHSLKPLASYRNYINFRYETTQRWLRRACATVKRVNPHCLADSLICVTPVCSDLWWGPGVAWDEVGYGTKIDFLTTDPYILLHNYLGDSTHWYVTETALRLSGAHPHHVCGLVLEPCRLRKEYRELDPVEVYGAALTGVWHGAREVFYFHHVHISGRSGVAAAPQATQRNVTAAYSLLEEIDPWLAGAHPWPGIAILHSRASEDWWRFYCLGLSEGNELQSPTPERPLTHPSVDPRYASLAQVEPLMALLRLGLPADLFYLDSVRAEDLAPYRVILVPFPYAVPDGAATLLEMLARQGKRVVVISEVGLLGEDGRLPDRPALLSLLGLRERPGGHKTQALAFPGVAVGDEAFSVYEHVAILPQVHVLASAAGKPVVIERRVGKGSLCFLAGEFGKELPVDYSNWHRGRDRRIYPPKLRPGHLRALLAALFPPAYNASSRAAAIPNTWPHLEPLPSLGPGSPRDDVEAAYMLNAQGHLLVLLINWRASDATAEVSLPQRYRRQPYNVRATDPSAKVTTWPCRWTREGLLQLHLAPQQALVLRLLPRS